MKKIKMFLTDCDGCLTDGGMYYSENGDELKKFNTRDGMGLKLLQENGIVTGMITGENRELNKRRYQKLQMNEYFPAVSDKFTVIMELCAKYNISLDEIAYVGDDINDVSVLKAVGMSFAPNDAQIEAKEAASIITNAKGGEGVIREAARIVLDNNSLEVK